MDEIERKPLRINGTVNEVSDKALFDDLSAIANKYRRMSRLRQLAALGLMFEQGRVAGAPVQQVAPAAITVQPEAPVQRPKPHEPERMVTAIRPEPTKSAPIKKGEKPTRTLSLMDRASLRIMD